MMKNSNFTFLHYTWLTTHSYPMVHNHGTLQARQFMSRGKSGGKAVGGAPMPCQGISHIGRHQCLVLATTSYHTGILVVLPNKTVSTMMPLIENNHLEAERFDPE